MKNIAFFLFGLFISTFTYGQNWDFKKPNYKEIEKNIKKKGSNQYYPLLMERYKLADSTLTLEEKRHLYYGYSFQSTYSPYGNSDYTDSINTILEKDHLSDSDLEKIVAYGDSILLTNPFDLRTINYQLYAFEQQLENKKFDAKIQQMKIILDALMSSGDGTSKKDAFYVIYTTHEYDLLEYLGFEFGGSQSLIEHYDYLKVVENDAEIDGLYFDVSPCLNSLSKMYK